MSITFFVDDLRRATAITALASLREVAALRDYAREEGARIDLNLVPDFDADAPSFDVRVCPLALASIAAHFALALDVIAVVDDAQFLGRRVRFTRRSTDLFGLTVSPVLDAEPEVIFANANGYALLEALGFETECVGDVPVVELRRRLEDDAVRARLRRAGLLDHAMRLGLLVSVAEQHELTKLAWG